MFNSVQGGVQVPEYTTVYNLASNDQEVWKHYCVRHGDNVVESDPRRKRGDLGNKYRSGQKVDEDGHRSHCDRGG